MKRQISIGKVSLILVAFLLMFLSGLVPPQLGLSAEGWQIACIFVGTLLLWLFVDTTWSSVLCMIALCFSPLYTYSSVLAGSWGNWIVSFLIFSSMVTYTLTQFGFLRRVAVWFITRPIAKKNPWVFLGLLFLAPLVIGAFMSPIPTFIVFVPIIEQIFQELGYKKGDHFPNVVTMGVLAAASVSTATTPIAHTFPILAMSLYAQDTGSTIDFMSYTAAGVVAGLVMYAIILLVLRFVAKPELTRLKNLDIDALKKDSGPLTKKETYSLIVFGVVVLLWMAPGPLQFIAPAAAKFINSFGTPMPAMIGVVALSLIKVDGEPLLRFKDAASKGVPWSAILLVAATMILSNALVNEKAGVVAALISAIGPAVQSMSPALFVFIVIMLTAVLTNFISNTVAVTMFYSVALPIVYASPAMGINPAALASMIGAASCIAMATPPATAHAALASGTGWLGTKSMLSYGMIISVLCGAVLALVGYPIAAALM